jgi:Mob1/phocein family
MKATDEWLYLCASHKSPQECSAIDYMIHSLDHATAIIHNSKNFNSRVSIPPASIKHLLSIVRRLYRLFTHTFFHHREIFMEFESEMHLCGRFTEFTKRFKMMSADLYIIPEEALKI